MISNLVYRERERERDLPKRYYAHTEPIKNHLSEIAAIKYTVAGTIPRASGLKISNPIQSNPINRLTEPQCVARYERRRGRVSTYMGSDPPLLISRPERPALRHESLMTGTRRSVARNERADTAARAASQPSVRLDEPPTRPSTSSCATIPQYTTGTMMLAAANVLRLRADALVVAVGAAVVVALMVLDGTGRRAGDDASASEAATNYRHQPTTAINHPHSMTWRPLTWPAAPRPGCVQVPRNKPRLGQASAIYRGTWTSKRYPQQSPEIFLFESNELCGSIAQVRQPLDLIFRYRHLL